jgi:hypothetical protein
LARQSATRLRRERIETARAAKPGKGPALGLPVPARTGLPASGHKAGNRSLRSPASEKRRAATMAAGARRQAKRDSR